MGQRRHGEPPEPTVTITPPDTAIRPPPGLGGDALVAALCPCGSGLHRVGAGDAAGDAEGSLRQGHPSAHRLAPDGGRLFRLNCAGCHGLAAQGLVGPNLHGVDRRKSDRQLIRQVISGNTPPMPSFQPEPQAMADLLAFLHSLP